jgi:ribosomal protein S18 acetylase RimI-like enzyme
MMNVSIESFPGPRCSLLPLFALADDSPTQIHRYIDLGEVLTARRAEQAIGHIQLIAHGAHWEIKSVAVLEQERRRGLGSALIATALARAFSTGATRVVVATATADIGNLRFYQRLGFRMDRVERDVFTADRGYPDLTVNGIPLRDRVWLSVDAESRRYL